MFTRAHKACVPVARERTIWYDGRLLGPCKRLSGNEFLVSPTCAAPAAHRTRCGKIHVSARMPRPKRKTGTKPSTGSFDAQAFLDSTGITKKIADYRPLEVIFAQGDTCESVMYIQKGAVRLSVLSHAG